MRQLSQSARNLSRSLVACLLICLVFSAAMPVVALGQPKELLIGIEPEHNIFDQVERRIPINANFNRAFISLIGDRLETVCNGLSTLHRDLSGTTALKNTIEKFLKSKQDNRTAVDNMAANLNIYKDQIKFRFKLNLDFLHFQKFKC